MLKYSFIAVSIISSPLWWPRFESVLTETALYKTYNIRIENKI